MISKDIHDYKNFIFTFCKEKSCELLDKKHLEALDVVLSNMIRFDGFNYCDFSSQEDCFYCETYRYDSTYHWHIPICDKEDLKVENFDFDFLGYGIIEFKLKNKGQMIINNI